jgi:serine/arginine repetitive matrix protein 1
MQIKLTGFLEAKTPEFMTELWTLLLSAQDSLGGIPKEFLEQKKLELQQKRVRCGFISYS